MHGMDTRTAAPRAHRWRALGITLSLLLLALSLGELLWQAGNDAPMWRGIALSSLYLGLCLSQRRLFAPARSFDRQRH